MRLIKFRAWYKNEKLMLPIAEIIFHKNWDIIAFPLTRVAISSYLVWGNVVLMQSTWLKDKNGRNIYEGDIVANLFYEGKKSLVIERENEYWGFNISYFLQECVINKDTREVVWNIYENPELLSQK
mgnify:CR=1 FL=1